MGYCGFSPVKRLLNLENVSSLLKSKWSTNLSDLLDIVVSSQMPAMQRLSSAVYSHLLLIQITVSQILSALMRSAAVCRTADWGWSKGIEMRLVKSNTPRMGMRFYFKRCFWMMLCFWNILIVCKINKNTTTTKKPYPETTTTTTTNPTRLSLPPKKTTPKNYLSRHPFTFFLLWSRRQVAYVPRKTWKNFSSTISAA